MPPRPARPARGRVPGVPEGLVATPRTIASLGPRALAATVRRPRMERVEETSAGGLVLDGWGPEARGALIGRLDRRGRLRWSLPKGHLEAGETAEQAAVREVEEETGIAGRIVASLGSIDFWFVAEGRRIHKTVHHYLLRALGGELSDADVEVSEVAWVPLDEIDARLAFRDERSLVGKAAALLGDDALLGQAGLDGEAGLDGNGGRPGAEAPVEDEPRGDGHVGGGPPGAPDGGGA